MTQIREANYFGPEGNVSFSPEFEIRFLESRHSRVRRRITRSLSKRFSAPCDLLHLNTNITADDLRFEYGFGFGALYHPYSEALKKSTPAEASDVLEAFFVGMQAYLDGLPPWEALPVQAWRYAPRRVIDRVVNRTPSTHFGIEDADVPKKARNRAEKLFALRDSIGKEGFSPSRPDRLTGVIIDSGKVLLLGGQHRAAVLDSLGRTEFPIVIRGRQHTPRRLRPNRLPLVRIGLMPQEAAISVLDRIRNGWSREDARKQGFPLIA